MCGGGGGDPGAEARRQEEDRQRRIKAAEAEISAIFNGATKVTKTRELPSTLKEVPIYSNGDGGEQLTGWRTEGSPGGTETYEEWVDPVGGNPRDKLYADQKTAVYDLNKREVDRQAAEAERLNRFGLARTGLMGGSVNVDSVADLDRRTNEGLMRAGGIAQSAADELEASDERARISLINTAQSGIDTGAAAQNALSSLNANANQASSARIGSTVGSLFNDLSQAYLANQTNQGRQSGMQYGSQWYGVSSPSQRYQGS